MAPLSAKSIHANVAWACSNVCMLKEVTPLGQNGFTSIHVNIHTCTPNTVFEKVILHEGKNAQQCMYVISEMYVCRHVWM